MTRIALVRASDGATANVTPDCLDAWIGYGWTKVDDLTKSQAAKLAAEQKAAADKAAAETEKEAAKAAKAKEQADADKAINAAVKA